MGRRGGKWPGVTCAAFNWRRRVGIPRLRCHVVWEAIVMKARATVWLILRTGFVLISVIGGLIHHDSHVKPEWPAFILVPTIVSFTIYISLSLISKRKSVQLERPLSLTLPFLPMRRYPLRFWLLCAVVFIGVGSSGILASYYKHQPLIGSSMFLFIGLGMFVAVLGWMHTNKHDA